MLLYSILAYTTHGKMEKKSQKNNKFKVSAPAWNKKFELPDGSILYQIFKTILRILSKKDPD